MNKALKILSLLLFGSLITANTLNIEPDGNGDWNVNYTSNGDMGRFQFNVEGGSLYDAFGGAAAANGFMISTEGSMVLGFSLTGSTIPAGEGTLVKLDVSGTPTELYNIVISDSYGIQLDFTFVPSGTEGCTDDSACNYNEEAAVDDGSCSYPGEGFNCDGNPLDFTFSQSTQQAAYFFMEVTIDENPIESNDWVGAFNGDICVGARQWNTNECNNNVCDIIVMGADGNEYTEGYMLLGGIPSFKILDVLESEYFDALPSENIPFENNGIFVLDSLEGGILGCTDNSACNYDDTANIDDSSCLENDCAGECGGSTVVDECGECGGDGVVQECGCGSDGEFGIPDGDCDCDGNIEDECDVCGGDNSSCSDECGVPNGDNSTCLDGCGIPNGDNSSCADCAGVPNGNAVVDMCNECDDNSANDCTQDCTGTWGGVAVDDECGVCGGDSSSCSDCASVPNGDAVVDNCGTCDNDASNDCTQDCSGVWGGGAVDDQCGVCDGDNSSCADCASVPNGDAVVDNCGTCDNDASNDCVQGCAGVWGGPSVDDQCGVCGGDDSSCSDECGVPYGDNSSCSDECGVPNGDNSSCSDCAGVPNGNSTLDECDVCDDDESNNCVQDCAGTWGGDSENDECSVCDGDGSTCNQPTANNFAVQVEEDGEVNFELAVSDPNNDVLLGHIITNPENGSLEKSGINLIYTPIGDYFGDDTFTYQVSDEQWTSNTATVSIQVIAVNDAPTANDFTLEVSGSMAVDFNEHVSDADADPLTILTLPPSPGETLNTIFGGTLTLSNNLEYDYTPPADEELPSDFILFKAFDNESESELAFGTFNINGRRWSREFEPTAFDDNVNMMEDQPKVITLVGFDVLYPFTGNESIIITEAPANGTLSDPILDSTSPQLTQWLVTFTPTENYTGSDQIKYKVVNPSNSNNNGESSEATISITINPINDLPELDPISDVEINEGGSSSITISATDVDNTLDLSVESSESSINVSLDLDDFSLNIIPEQEFNGSGTITVTATEISGAELSTSQVFSVNVLPVNDPPIITSVALDSVEIGNLFSYQVGVEDIDDIVINYSIEGAPAGMNMNGGGFISWSPDTPESYGPITVTASDGEYSDSQEFTLTAYYVDCAGDINGDAEEDNCGTCDNIPENDCVQGCDGIWGSGLSDDECDVCGGNNSSCADCAGVPNGSAVEDNCGTCDADSSNDCTQDCAGNWGGGAVVDECNICGGDNSSCADCAGVPNGNAVADNCGTCDSDGSNDCVQDCSGVWGGTSVVDECGICGGDNSSCVDCAGTPNGNAVADNCGICDSDGSNDCVQDCQGTWGGDIVVDDCSVCGGDNSTCSDDCGVPYGDNSSCADDCGVPYGDNSSCSDCTNTPNGDAEIDDCNVCSGGNSDHEANSDKDCVGVCFGDAVTDDCGVCVGGTTPNEFNYAMDCNGDCCGGTPNDVDGCGAIEDNCGTCDNIPENDCVQDCAGVWGGSSVGDVCGVCSGDNSSCEDCLGDLGGGAYEDECGTCDNIPENDCVQGCDGTWGSGLVFDECGVCGGDGPVVGLTCDGIPINFEYNQSSSQAFYYIHETIDLLGDPLTAEDWVATFNGEICVGSYQWDTSQCNSGICDVPAMGDDGFTPGTENYLQPGDFPSFKIYDYSEGEYFNVYPSENYPFEENAIFNIDELTLDLSYSIPLHQYNNLVSFYVLIEDNSVSNVMLDIQENISYVIGESESAQLVGNDWTGSLTSLDLSSGYWLNLTDSDTLDGIGHPLNPDRVYNLHSGANLVSFPSPGFVGISAGLPNDIEDKVIAIIGEGFSSINTEYGWMGSVLNFEALHGYWIITNEAISFSYELDSLETLSRSINLYKTAEKPLGFDFIQSSQQAFYFVDNVELIESEMEKGDWIISYCGNMVTGSRLWLGRTVDIPVMGAEGTPVTAGYCEANDTPNFKLYKSGSQELIALHAEIPRWQSNGIFQLATLKESAPTPNEYSMGSAYPNPFNPITQIGYEIPAESQVEISVFDLRGQKVATLVNEFTKPGAYSITWDAAKIASGVYFVHFTATGEGMAAVSQIQKLMLIK